MSKSKPSIALSIVLIIFLFRKKILLYRISNISNDKTLAIMKSAKSNEQKETKKEPIKSLKRLYLALEDDDIRKQFKKKDFIDLFFKFSIQIPMFRLIEYLGSALEKKLKDHYSIDLEDVINQRITKFNNLLHTSFFTYPSLLKDGFENWFKEIPIDRFVSYSSLDFLATLAKETPKEMEYREKLLNCLFARIESDEKLKYAFRNFDESILTIVTNLKLQDNSILLTFKSGSNFFYYIKAILLNEYFKYMKKHIRHDDGLENSTNKDQEADVKASRYVKKSKTENRNDTNSNINQSFIDVVKPHDENYHTYSDNYELTNFLNYLTIIKILFSDKINFSPHRKLIFWIESAYFLRKRSHNTGQTADQDFDINPDYTSQTDHDLFLRNYIDDTLGEIFNFIFTSINLHCENFFALNPNLLDNKIIIDLKDAVEAIRTFEKEKLNVKFSEVYWHRHYEHLKMFFTDTMVKDVPLASLFIKIKHRLNNQISKWNNQTLEELQVCLGIIEPKKKANKKVDGNYGDKKANS
jgi:hypothetical protein